MSKIKKTIKIFLLKFFMFHSFENPCIHTCDDFERIIREICPSFQGGVQKMYRIYREIHGSFQGDFDFSLKNGTSLKTFMAHFLESP